MIALIMVVYYISGWGGKMFMVILVFEFLRVSLGTV